MAIVTRLPLAEAHGRMPPPDNTERLLTPGPDWEGFRRTREDLLRRQLSNNENFDRAILTLSSALLAVSLAWLSRLYAPCCLAVLISSWFFLLAAIGVTLVSFFVSQAGIRKQLAAARRYYLDGEDESRDEVSAYDTANTIMGYVAAVCFAGGILQMMLFAGLNLTPKENHVIPHQPDGNPQRVEGGASIPQLMPRNSEQRGASIPDMAPRQPQGNITDSGAATPPSTPAANPSQPATPPTGS